MMSCQLSWMPHVPRQGAAGSWFRAGRGGATKAAGLAEETMCQPCVNHVSSMCQPGFDTVDSFLA
jgi:hypothetical protein